MNDTNGNRQWLAGMAFLLIQVFFGVNDTVVAQSKLPSLKEQLSRNATADSNIQSFDLVWNTIQTTYWEPTRISGIWDRARAELRSRIRPGMSRSNARTVMQELVDRLGDSHFVIIPAKGESTSGSVGDFDAGIKVRWIDSEPVVLSVNENSDAWKLGVKPGWAIDMIRGKTVKEITDLPTMAIQSRLETRLALNANSLLTGTAVEKLAVGFRDFENRRHVLDLALAKSPGMPTQSGNLPPMRLAMESRTLRNGIGYFQFSAFLDPFALMPAFGEAVRNPQHQNGLIIDLRDNMGGQAAMVMGMAGLFASKTTELGTMTTRNGHLFFVANPVPNPYQGKVAVLVDEVTLSAAEILAAAFHDMGVAHVFGTQTAGMALPSMIIKLPNGDYLQYAIADYQRASGVSLEQVGVEPDHPIPLTRELLRQKSDPVLEAALAWIGPVAGKTGPAPPTLQESPMPADQ